MSDDRNHTLQKKDHLIGRQIAEILGKRGHITKTRTTPYLFGLLLASKVDASSLPEEAPKTRNKLL